jgi:peptidoglycan hydrolase CwlO-like protein
MDTDNLSFSPPVMVRVETDMLKLINDKLGILELVSKDIKKLKTSKEMSDEKSTTLKKQTNKLKGTVNKTENDVNELKKENIFLREALLDIQTRSMERKSGTYWYPRERRRTS